MGSERLNVKTASMSHTVLRQYGQADTAEKRSARLFRPVRHPPVGGRAAGKTCA